MGCEFSESICEVLAAVEPTRDIIVQKIYSVIAAIRKFLEFLEPHVKWLGALLTIAAAVWHKWQTSENKTFDRFAKLIDNQNKRTENSRVHTVNLITKPLFSTKPEFPLFAAKELNAVFKRRSWRSAVVLTKPMEKADKKLVVVHDVLNKENSRALAYATFVAQQRFSTFIVEGALASARSENASLEIRGDSP
jgi:hypothetical protein